MKKWLLTGLSTIVLGVSYGAEPTLSEQAEIGKVKFEQICIACHKSERSDVMIAPPIFAIKIHYTQSFGGDREAFVQSVVDWVKSPSEKSSLMPGAVSRFKLMPPMPLPDEDLKAIATYLFEYKFEKPDWYDEHQRQERRRLGL